MAAPPVPTSITPVQGGIVTTTTPTLTAILGADPDGDRVRAEWQCAKNSAFTDTLITLIESSIDSRLSGTASQVMLSTASLDTGTWYLRARSIDSTNTASAYSTSTTFTVQLPPISPPTDIAPSNNAVLSTSRPVLSGIVVPASHNRKSGIQWQFAIDSLFTLQVQTYTSTSTEEVTSGAIFHKADSDIHQGIWYARVRAYSGSVFSEWTNSFRFVVFHQPSAILRGEQSGVTLPSEKSLVLSWDFNDPSESDTQTAYQLQIEENEHGILLLDSSKVGSSVSSYTVPIALQKDVILRWKVRVWDNDDQAGPWSSYSTFTISDRPVVVITSPTPGSTIPTGAPVVRWTVTATNGRVQEFFSILVTNAATGEVLVDTGFVESSNTEYAITNLPTGITWNLTLTVIDSSGLSSA